MTIAIAVAVPDGLALAADTQTTWTRTITHAAEKGTGNQFELAEPIGVPIGWSRLARKLFAVTAQGHVYAVAVSGAALINNKTPYSIIKSLEKTYAGPGTYDSVRDYLFEGIKGELRQQCGVAELRQVTQITELNFILAGYEGRDVSRPILRAFGVYSGSPQGIADPTGDRTFWANDGVLRFNCCWIGRVDFVSHLVSH